MSDQYPREPVPEEAANRPARTVGMIVSNAVMGVPVIMLGASLAAVAAVRPGAAGLDESIQRFDVSRSKRSRNRSAQDFADHVLAELPPQFPLDPLTVSRGVMEVLWEKVDPGESAKVIDQLPTPLKGLWPEIARRG